MANPLVVPEPEHAAALYQAHGRAVRAYVGSRIHDPGVVEDICQETFVAALDRGVPPEGVGRWLFGIARNKLRKHHRDAKPVAPVEQSSAEARESSPPEQLGQHEERTRVRAAVDGLEETLREVIRLRYEGGMDYRAIADHLEVPLSTVQGRLKRARLALREQLLPEGTR